MHSGVPHECIFFRMTIKETIKFIENWAPKEAAWAKDNPGLQVGSPDAEVKNIFLCLELSGQALKEAIKKKCNFVFTHHPLIFNPIKRIDLTNDKTSALISQIIKNDLTLYSAHTNLDFTKDGVSFQLAHTLKLQNIRFLEQSESNQMKLVVFVPADKADDVASAVFNAGGGVIGEYENCSFRMLGTGTFRGSEKSDPAIGEAGKFETVNETRIEFLLNKWDAKKVISAMIKVHPYEEPAYDLQPVDNKNTNFGFGAIGDLPKPLDEHEFLKHVKTSLNAQNLRFTKGKTKKIKSVALCGGSGSEMLHSAIAGGADAFVTADVKYHAFQDAEDKILLIDAGHYETEFPVLKEVKKRLEEFLKSNGNNNKVYIYSGSTNPINFYK